jgi:hypothetical protein
MQTQSLQSMSTPTPRTGPGCDLPAGGSARVTATLSRESRLVHQSSSLPRRCLATSVRGISNPARPKTACHDIPEFRNIGGSSPLPPSRNNLAARGSACSLIPFPPQRPRRGERACTILPGEAMSKEGARAIRASGTHFQLPTELSCVLG